jgi:hypothetical protein
MDPVVQRSANQAQPVEQRCGQYCLLEINNCLQRVQNSIFVNKFFVEEKR